MLVLTRNPIVTVTSVKPVWMSTVGSALSPSTGYRLNTTLDMIQLYYGYSYEYEVAYSAGRSVIPTDMRLAGMMLAAHNWQQTQNNKAGGRPRVRSGSNKGDHHAPVSARQLRAARPRCTACHGRSWTGSRTTSLSWWRRWRSAPSRPSWTTWSAHYGRCSPVLRCSTVGQSLSRKPTRYASATPPRASLRWRTP